MLALLSLLVAQADTPGPLLDRVRGGGPDAFHALSALADLGPEHDAGVKAAAADLPPFFRDAVLSEIGLARSLGPDFGRPARLRSDGRVRSPRVLVEWLRKESGLRIEPGYTIRNGNREAFALPEGEMTAMEALAAICTETKQTPHIYGSSTLTLNQAATAVPPFTYRNFAVFPGTLSLRKRSDFGGPSPWTCRIAFTGAADPQVRLAGWRKTFRLVEAVTDDGRSLEVWEDEEDSAFRYSATRSSSERRTVHNSGFGVALRLPDGKRPEKIARLRGVATAVLAREVRSFVLETFEPPEKATTGDGEFEITFVESSGRGRRQTEVVVFVRAAGMDSEALLELPLRFDLTYKGMGEGHTWVTGTPRDGGVDFRVRWWTYDSRQVGQEGPELERVEVSVPRGFVDRPLYVEFADIPLQ